ncbi:11619_t:CDS:1 [Scutellospora calospora]|uniref:11619_t:CDS:1 n=1 Tax=Scutellospora calospora TaxID=85575 RepID=A0ACA9MSB5_9GLOM|nr:11619_t:CDS:1 [Scutellospora calospora]
MPKTHSPIYYIVLIGRTPGIYYSLEDCKEQVNNFPNSSYKKFFILESAYKYYENFQNKMKEKEDLINSENKIIIYTDGSCINNNKGIHAGIGIYYKDRTKKITEPLPGTIRTNNRAELFAVIRAIETCEDQEKILEIRTDSRYVVNACESWITKWKENNWKTIRGEDVKNRDLFEKFDKLMNNRKGKIFFTFVKAHNSIIENEIADRLARRGATINMWNEKKLSPYNSYMKNTLPKYKKENPSLEHKIAFKNVAAMWKDSSENPKNI